MNILKIVRHESNSNTNTCYVVECYKYCLLQTVLLLVLPCTKLEFDTLVNVCRIIFSSFISALLNILHK